VAAFFFSQTEIAMQTNTSRWYLVRTKQYKEALVRSTLSHRIADSFLPLLRTRRRQGGRLAHTITPLFPCYLFALFDVATQYHFISRTPGVVGVLCAGDEPSVVDDNVIEEIKQRGRNGIVELSPETFSAGESVNLVAGPLRGISAVFERYLSGAERAALLVDLIGGANVRVIVSSELLTRVDRRAS
jgi:transcriptional antiterminator RfaH